MSIIPRNKTEIMFIDTIKKAHEFLNDKLNLDTKLDIERVCYWGKDAFHSGCYYGGNNAVVINFRNLYGFSLKTVLTVLGHEFRHAYQQDKGWIIDDGFKSKNSSKGHIESGTWKGNYIKWVEYKKLPWEIDARKFEEKYAEYFFKSNLIKKKDLKIKLDGDKTFKPLIDETEEEINNKFGQENVQFFTHYLDYSKSEKDVMKKDIKSSMDILKSLGGYEYKNGRYLFKWNKNKDIHIKQTKLIEKVNNLENKIINKKVDKKGFCYLTLNQINKNLKKPFKTWSNKAVELAFSDYSDLIKKQYVAYKTRELTIRDLNS